MGTSLMHFLRATLIYMRIIILYPIHLIKNIATFVGGIFKTVFFSCFDFFITLPLQLFYYNTLYKGRPHPALCSEFGYLDHTAEFWNSSMETRQECEQMLDRYFNSFQTAILVSIYMGFVVIIIFRIAMFFCYFRLFK